MPSAYQTFKNEMFKEIKSKYFTDYKIKEGEKIQTLVAQKCKEEWESLPEDEKEIYKCKSKEQRDPKETPPPPYKQKESDDEEEVDVKTQLLMSAINIAKNNRKPIDSAGYEYNSPLEFDKNNSERQMIDFLNETINKSRKETNTCKSKTKSKSKKSSDQRKSESSVNKKTDTSKEKNKRKKVPKAVKESIWKKYISEIELKGKCFVGCGTDIQINNFEAGHVIPVCEGGENTIENLRPICSLCNKSMGTQNLNDFIKSFGFEREEIIEKEDITKFDSEIKMNEKQIIEIEKEIKKTKKSSKMLLDKQDDISKKIEELNELINNTIIELEVAKKTFTSNELKIQELEEIAKQKKKEKEKIKNDTSILVTKKESCIRNKIIEEEKLKEEIRKELLLEQKKEELREQVKREMGLI